MSEFDNEMNRGLDGLVKTTNYRDWVNPVDPSDQELTRAFRASPIQRNEEQTSTPPVKDVDDDAPRRFLGEELDEDQSRVEEGGEVVRGNLPRAAETEEVPEGNIRQVLRWVDEDKEKAQRALDTEKEKEDPRKTLIEKLEEIIED